MKRFFPSLFFFLALLCAQAPSHAEETIVAEVNGVPITSRQVEEEMKEILPRLFGHRELSEGRMEEIRRGVLHDLIKKELLFQEARRQGLSIEPVEVEGEVEKIRQRFPSRQAFRDSLQTEGLTIEKVRAGVERFLLIAKLYEREVIKRVSISEKDLVVYWETHPERFQAPEEIRLRVILIRGDPARGKDQQEEALKKANEIIRRTREGVPFDELAREFTEDEATRERGGDLGFFSRGQMRIKEVEAVALSLSQGEVSPPVETSFGYVVVKVEEKRPARPLPFSEIDREGLKRELWDSVVEKRREELIHTLWESAEVKIHR